MKNSYWIYICAVYIVFTACKKEIGRPAPDFDVSASAATYSVGEEVVFNFTGNADLISFYSGEISSDYAFREGRVIEPGVLKISFQTNVEFGAQANQLSIMASSDFNGSYAFPGGIEAATWTNITDRFALSTNVTYVNSGQVNVSDLLVEGKPFYIGLRYAVRNQNTFGAARTWRIQNFLLTSETSIGLVELGNQQTAGFQIVDKKPDIAPHRSSVSATNVVLRAAVRTTDNETVETENWAISKAFSVGKQDLGPDRPVPIKGIVDARIEEFTHVYDKPGKYKVYFVASNTNIYDTQEVIRSVDIEIVP